MRIPPPSAGRPAKYDFSRLLVEDQIFIDTDMPELARNSAYQYAKYHKIKIVTRIKSGGLMIFKTKEV